jgi:hypothetical protein
MCLGELQAAPRFAGYGAPTLKYGRSLPVFAPVEVALLAAKERLARTLRKAAAALAEDSGIEEGSSHGL